MHRISSTRDCDRGSGGQCRGRVGLNVSVFPQLFLNNPNDAVRRGIAPASEAFLLPFEFSKKIGPVDVDYEIGYQFAHKGPDSSLTGLVVGHDFTPKLEGDMEFNYQGTFHPAESQPTIDFGARYKIHRPAILLFMAGRSLEPARSNQPYFVGYFWRSIPAAELLQIGFTGKHWRKLKSD